MATQNAWKVRKIREGIADIEQLLFHPDNPKIHPRRQTESLKGAIRELGWMAMIKINLRTSEEWPDGDRHVETVIDGHDRIKAAAEDGETQVPVEYYDLTPNEERVFIASFDEIAKMSGLDRDAFSRLLEDLNAGEESLQKLFTNTANELGLLLGDYEEEELNFSPIGDDEQPRLDELKPVYCPHCGENIHDKA